MKIDFLMISRVLISPYFSFLLVLCSLLLYIVYRSEEGGRFPVERKIAKYGSLIYLALGVITFIFGWFI
ncbi:MAG: hypothetical protein GX024_09655 [Clostridiales bacterium]|jgi:hypothetical protein|nr:hypothetical protein [Clostridiales bacterium]